MSDIVTVGIAEPDSGKITEYTTVSISQVKDSEEFRGRDRLKSIPLNNYTRFLHRKFDIKDEITECEMLADKFVICRPLKIRMLAIDENGNNISGLLEIKNITIMGIPQTASSERWCNSPGFLHFSKEGMEKDRYMNVLIFNSPTDVSFGTFGACEGQGLNIEIINRKHINCTLYVMIDAVDSNDNIGTYH